jgi:hypothetical protein
MNVKKTEIINYLELNNFQKIDDKFDYLIKMSIFNLTFEKKEELLREYNEKNSDYQWYKEQTVQSLWKQDLDDLEVQLQILE